MAANGVQALRKLHEDYVWRVNAAIGEGREDIVARLVAEYPDAALRLLTECAAPACDRPGCAACAAPRPRAPTGGRRARWAAWLGARRRRG
ncbi:MAG: hypothetical protein ACJ73E_11625 [Mycobacteriales bacterium]